MVNRGVWWLLCLSAAVMWTAIPLVVPLVQQSYEPEVSLFGPNDNHATAAATAALVARMCALGASCVFGVGVLVAAFRGWRPLNRMGNTEQDGQFDATRQGRYTKELGRPHTDLPPAVPTFAIVATAMAAALIAWVPPIGLVLGIAATTAWLMTAYAMLFGPLSTPINGTQRGFAYLGVYNDTVDPRLIVGTIVILVTANLVHSSAVYVTVSAFFDPSFQGHPGWVRSLVDTSVYSVLSTVPMVAVPAWLYSRSRPIRPNTLLGAVFGGTTIGCVAAAIVFTGLNGSKTSYLETAFYPVIFGFTATTVAAATLEALSRVRHPLLAIAAAWATVLVTTNLVEAMYISVSSNLVINGTLTPIHHLANMVGSWGIHPQFFIVEAAVVAIGLTVLHTAVGSPLIADKTA